MQTLHAGSVEEAVGKTSSATWVLAKTNKRMKIIGIIRRFRIVITAVEGLVALSVMFALSSINEFIN